MKLPHVIFPIALSFAFAPFAGAMIASVNGNVTYNTEATDYVSEIWNRTVQLNAGTGTYLGQSSDGMHWVMTAAHVTVGNGTIVTSTGETINLTAVPAQKVFFYNADGTKADLQLFAVSANTSGEDYLNALGNIKIYEGELYYNTSLYCVGTGRKLEMGKSTNDVSFSSRVKQWGEFYGEGYVTDGSNLYIREVFSESGLSLQCGLQDSGSGVFVDTGDSWELRAIAVSVGPNDSALDDPIGYASELDKSLCCETYFLNLSAYASQIYAVIPEPSLFGLMAGIFALGLAGARRCRKRA